MAAWESREPLYRLKAVGAAGWTMDADWFDHEPNQTTLIRFSNKSPAGIRPDDWLLYYASGYQKLFGIVRIFSKPVRDEVEERWPWSSQVRSKIIIRDLDRAPHLDLLSEVEDRDWHQFVMQMDYREISEDVFAYAATKLIEVVDVSKGDLVDAAFAASYSHPSSA